jgi:SPP1 family predicted phage head-tail adaptor
MSLVTAAELADLKAEQVDALPDTCVLKTKTATNTSTGRIYTEGGDTTVACRVGPISREEQILAGRTGIVADAVIAFADSQAVTNGQRITTGGVTYEVIGPDVDRTWRTANTVRVKKVTAGA